MVSRQCAAEGQLLLKTLIQWPPLTNMETDNVLLVGESVRAHLLVVVIVVVEGFPNQVLYQSLAPYVPC